MHRRDLFALGAAIGDRAPPPMRSAAAREGRRREAYTSILPSSEITSPSSTPVSPR